jgi:biotin carboxylase
VGKTIAVDYTNLQVMLGIASQLHESDRLDAVISVDEYALHVAADIGRKLKVRACDHGAVQFGRDKGRMRERLHANGIDTTRFQLCSDLEEAIAFAASTPQGVILKPTDGAGGLGVCAASDATELKHAWQFAHAKSHGGSIIVEEQIHGQEYSVETVTVDGRHTVIAVTEKTTTGSPYFVEIGHATSIDTSSPTFSLLSDAVSTALDAIGVNVGPCHTEVIVGPHGVSIIEINTRMGGAFIWELVELATGVDLFRVSMTSLVDDIAPTTPVQRLGAAIAFMRSPCLGLVQNVYGLEAAYSVPGVVRIDRIPAPGTAVFPMSDRSHRLGFAIAVGVNYREAATRAQQAVASISLELEAIAEEE